jgi:hypothetical protein
MTRDEAELLVAEHCHGSPRSIRHRTVGQVVARRRRMTRARNSANGPPERAATPFRPLATPRPLRRTRPCHAPDVALGPAERQAHLHDPLRWRRRAPRVEVLARTGVLAEALRLGDYTHAEYELRLAVAVVRHAADDSDGARAVL